jgi:hypothetical protein
MKNIFKVALLLLFTQNCLSGQSFFAKKNDVSVNMTSVLGKILSIVDDSEDESIGVFIRRKTDKKGLYIGLGSLLDKEGFFQNNIFVETKRENINGRLGFEKYKNLSSKFMLGFGGSLIGGYKSETISENGQVGVFTKLRTIQFGGGPVLKIEYKIGNFISLTTESSLFAIFNNKRTIVETINDRDILSNNGYVLSTNIPNLLYLNVHF